MKTKTIAIAAIAAAAILSASSCQKEPTVIPAQEVAGSYSGSLSAEFIYSDTPMVSENQTLTVTASGDNTVNLSYTSDTWGSFSVSDASVSASNPYTISGSGTVAMGMGGNTNDYEFTLSGSVNTTTAAAEFVFTVPAVMGGLTLTFTAE